MTYFLFFLLFVELAVIILLLLGRHHTVVASRTVDEKPDVTEASTRTEFVQQLIDRYEAELQTMGADIHDDLIQRLTVYRLYVDKLERVDTILGVHFLTNQMKKDFEEIEGAIRKISRRLLPDGDFGSFSEMLHELCQRMEVPGVAFITFKAMGSERSFNTNHQQHLLRIVQELINNVVKHTPAWHVEVKLEYRANELVIEVRDDGKAFREIQQALANRDLLFFSLRMRLQITRSTLAFVAVPNGTMAILRYTV